MGDARVRDSRENSGGLKKIYAGIKKNLTPFFSLTSGEREKKGK
tara:strand:+ start:416 stop:547 length:132 start_codon:yes stop_codon:yes gene_type:complete